MRLPNLILCKAQLIIYKSSILPHLTHCHLLWHNCRSSDSRKIEQIQNAHLEQCLTPIQNHTKTFSFVQLPSLLNRRLQDIVILMHKVKYGLTPSIVDELFKQKCTSGYSLRNSDFDNPTFNNINYGKHFLRYKWPHVWSKLDNKLKGSSNIESF